MIKPNGVNIFLPEFTIGLAHCLFLGVNNARHNFINAFLLVSDERYSRRIHKYALTNNLRSEWYLWKQELVSSRVPPALHLYNGEPRAYSRNMLDYRTCILTNTVANNNQMEIPRSQVPRNCIYKICFGHGNALRAN